MVAAPVDLRTKKAEKLLTTGNARLLVKDENKEPQGSCDVPDGFYQIHYPTGSHMATVPSVLSHSRVSNSRRQNQETFGV